MKQKYDQTFADQYTVWAGKNKCIQQVSMPRSGGHWLRWIVSGVSGRKSYDLAFRAVGSILDDLPHNTYFNNHRFFYNFSGGKYVFLVRDPRDTILSNLKWSIREENIDYTKDMIWLEKRVNVYRQHFERYLVRNTLVVQYEHICLYPERAIERLFDFIDYDIKNDILSVVEGLDGTGYMCLDKSPFNSGRLRYDAHCLNWLDYTEFRHIHNEYIWDNLRDIMIHYGYTKDGHSPGVFNL